MEDLRFILDQLTLLTQAAETLADITPAPADTEESTVDALLKRLTDAVNGYSISLSSLSDISGMDSAVIGQFLRFDGEYWSPSSPALSSMSDVSSVAPASGQLLGWNLTNATWEPVTEAVGVENLADLGDTAVDSPSSGDGVEWNGTSWAKVTNNVTLTDLSTYLTGIDLANYVTDAEIAAMVTNSDIANMVETTDSITALADVSFGTPAVKEALVFNGSSWVDTSLTATHISDFDTEVANNASVATNTAHRALTNNPHAVTSAQVQAVSTGSSAFTSDFTQATNPPTTSMVLVEAIAGSMRWATLSALPVSTDVQTELDTKSEGYHTRTFYIENPTASDSYPIGAFPVACTITRVTFITDAGTVDFNLEERVEATPLTAGTNVFSVDDQASSTNSVVTSFANAGMAANAWLWYAASAVASSPTKLIIKITYTED